MGDGRLDRVGVGDGHDDAARVAWRPAGATAPTDAVLHLGEGLAAGEAEAARVALHGAPLGQLHELLQLGAGPLAEVALEQAPVDGDLQPAGLGDRGGRLAGPLERRGVDRVDPRQLGDARRRRRRPARGPRRPGAGPGARPGRIVPVVGVWPWRTRSTSVGGGGLRERVEGRVEARRVVAMVSRSTYRRRRGLAHGRDRRRRRPAGPAPAWWPGASRSAGRSGPPSPARTTGPGRCPGFGSTRGAGSWSSAWRRRPTAATAPAGCSPATARATGCSASMYRAGLANQPDERRSSTTACELARRLHHRRRALRAAGQQADARRARPRAGRTSSASWRCCADVRVIVVPRRRSPTRTWPRVLGVRPRPRFGHGVEVAGARRPHAAVLVPPEPAEHLHRQAHRADARRRLRAGGGTGANRTVSAGPYRRP